jgi:UDP-N-acetylmuramoyl-L-alanyl-D-glutamate--2,6-diaminopimelate ligase
MISFDSRLIKSGDTFVAIKGQTSDGHDHINEAIKNGAKVIYGEKDIEVGSDVNYIKVKNSREKLGELASEYYKDPSSKLTIIGVTGTKGKTTTCHLIYHILTKLGKKTGLISSISVPGYHVTTPDVITLNKMLKGFVDKGFNYVVLEVSSHGIEQGRIAGIKFDIGVLTNIAPEHLDYHKTFKSYKNTKMSFLKSCKIQIISPKSTKLKILEGDFNNINAQTAIEVCEKLGISEKESKNALNSFKLPTGRLEEIENSLGIKIFVDFAHTPDSLEAVLGYLKTITKGRLISVFGCAGERDIKKRSKMGKISGEIADISVLTAEDPRSENIFDILKQMKKYAKNYICIPERGEAISYAIRIAKKGDTLVFCGKGHEITMAYGGFEHPWSDQNFIKNILNGHKDLAGVILAAGRGTRMKSDLPKVLHNICGRPMISYSMENLRNAGVINLVPVVGYKRNLVLREISKECNYAVQETTLGTGNSVLKALKKIDLKYTNILVIYGDDSAFYKPATIKNVIEIHKNSNAVLTFVSLIQENPFGLGRVIRDKNDNLIGIIEEKDANESQKKVKEVNDGLYIFKSNWLRKNINKINKSPVTGEYYLTDLIKFALGENQKVSVYKLPDANEWQGINTPEQLQNAERKMSKRING